MGFFVGRKEPAYDCLDILRLFEEGAELIVVEARRSKGIEPLEGDRGDRPGSRGGLEIFTRRKVERKKKTKGNRPDPQG